VILVLIVLFPHRLALDPAVIAPGFAQDGQQTPAAGQVASLTSTNNFINFCLTVKKPITNGQQIKTGSCNPAPMGVIAATTNMPSSKFVTPVNGQDFGANAAFTISMAVNNLQTGNFVNAQSNYYSAPQQVNGQGDIIGHTHFTVQQVPSFTSTAPLDPKVFAFFKGVNTAAVNGVVSVPVAAGLPAGSYRVCSINTDANHTPCLVAVAQHGSLDDCVYVSRDHLMYLEFRLIHVCSSPSVVPLVTILSRRAMQLVPPAMQRVLLVPPAMLQVPLVMLQVPLVMLQVPLVMLQVLLVPLAMQRVLLVPPAMLRVLLAKVLLAKVLPQVKGRVQGRQRVVKEHGAVVKWVVVACVWVPVNPASVVITKLRDVTLPLRSDCRLG
jgi:hypothetical protein